MTEPDPTLVRAHEDRDMFLEAVSFTAAETGFSARLVEKDYFCTVLLQYLAETEALVFKGGTCLARCMPSSTD
jgi:predicted nucleotidyltransferase component of viral defense system